MDKKASCGRIQVWNDVLIHDGVSWINSGLSTDIIAVDGLTNVGSSANLTSALNSYFVHRTGSETIGGIKTFSDNVIINGNLTVNGDSTTITTETLVVQDPIIEINKNSGTIR